MAVGSLLKRCDVYRKIPQEYTEPTLSGAVVSILSTVIMVLLFVSEFSTFLEVNETSEMYVDYARSEQKLQVNLDVVFDRLPCDVLSLDAQDVMGSHHVNLEGDLKKYKIDVNGKVLEATKVEHKDHEHAGHAHDQSDQVDVNGVAASFEKKEGCQIKGYIKINKVPGNFHISSHAFGGVLQRLFQQGKLQTLDLSHTINHLSFGRHQDIRYIKKKFTKGVLNPLDGTTKKNAQQGNQGTTYQYYISIVPSIYEDQRSRQYSVYQFTSNNNEMHTHHLPAVYFRYDLSPVTVKFKLQTESFFHFLVQICAIIGGVFTVAGIIDSMVHKGIRTIIKKAELNKLS